MEYQALKTRYSIGMHFSVSGYFIMISSKSLFMFFELIKEFKIFNSTFIDSTLLYTFLKST